MRKLLLFALIMLIGSAAHGQIKFSTYSESDIILTQLGSGELDFGMVMSSLDPYVIELGDPQMVVFAIEGVEYYDVIVTIDAPAELALDAENKIHFELKAAYANRGQNQISDAHLFNGDIDRFQIKRRGVGPPGPPPVPEHGGYTHPTATAYLFLYGNLTVGNVDAGQYEGTVNITVEYD